MGSGDDGNTGTKTLASGSVVGMDEIEDYRNISYEAVLNEECKPGYMMLTAIRKSA